MKVEQIIETLSYLEKFKENIVVIKFGGDLHNLSTTLFFDVALLKKVGMHPVLVHGGGKDITSHLEKKKLEVKFVEGLRVTDEKSIKVVVNVLTKIRKHVISEIKKYYKKCIGYPTKYKDIFITKKLMLRNKIDLGYVGEIKHVITDIIYKKIFSGFIPVISSFGRGEDNRFYNINADVCAAKLAIALRCEKLFFLTDVKGIYSDFEKKDTLLSQINIKEGLDMIRKGRISSGMIPKLQSSIDAIKGGVNSCHIISGKTPHALLLEIFTESGLGTMVKE